MRQMATITKKDLIDHIANQTRQRRVDVKLTIHAFLELIVQELAEGNRIEFRDFGVFDVKERAARIAQNPKTLEPVEVPPKRSVKFKPGRRMRELLEERQPVVEVVRRRRVGAVVDNGERA